jgi:multiple sugar transport system substrate-binding protein
MKAIWFSTLLLVITVIMAGCASPQKPGLITFSFMVSGDLAELQAYQKLVASFENQNPNIKIELIHIPGQSEYRTRLAADFAAGTPADVVLINYRRFGPYAAKLALESLGPYLENSTLISKEDFYPQAIEPFTWQGQVMCIPQNLSSLVVYYNKELFDQAGVAHPTNDWTWEDFLSTAQKLTRDLDGDGRPDQHGLGFEISLARFAPFIWQHGGQVVNNNYSPTRLTLDHPLSLDAIRWVVELQTKHHIVPDAEQEAAEDSESRFLNGRLAMYLNSRRGVPTYREITGFDWDIAPLPRDAHVASLVHADAYCMASTVRNKDIVWKFIEFANSVEGQTIIAASGRTVPSLRSVAESAVFLDPQQKPHNSRVFLEMIPYLRPLPSSASWIDAEEVADNELQRAFYGKASIEDAIQSAILLAEPYLGETDSH